MDASHIEKNPIGEFVLEKARAEWFAWMTAQDADWGDTYRTYKDNPDVDKQYKDDFSRIYSEVHTSLEEEKALLEAELRNRFPTMNTYEIVTEEGKVYVY